MRTIFNLSIVLLGFMLLTTGCQKEAASFVNTGTNLEPPTANAGTSQFVQPPASTATLTGVGTTLNGGITGYLWSLVSGPNVPVINSPSSPTTTVGSLVSGVYIFQFMVIDSAGLTGVDTMMVTILPSLQQTLTLQPSNNPTELNFAGYTTGADLSSHDIDLDASAWTMGGNEFEIRGSFKFDLSSIPATATILSAKLSLYSNLTPTNGNLVDANSGPDNSFFIQRITSPWTVPGATWATQPSTSSTDQVAIAHTGLTSLDLIDVDVTSLVSPMVATNNYGFMLRLQNEVIYNIRQFCSSKHADATKHPKLVVVYQP